MNRAAPAMHTSMVLDDEQSMLRESARAFCAEKAPIRQLRRLRDDEHPQGFDRSTWQAMVDLGWAAIPWQVRHGGLAFGYMGLGVVTEETGRCLVASPLHATVWAGGSAIDIGGSEMQRGELLPRIAAGTLLLALALQESHHHQPYAIATQARRVPSGYQLDGVKTFVLDGHVADRLIVAARTSGAAGERAGLSLFLVERDAPGVEVTRLSMVDSRNAASVRFANVCVPTQALIGEIDRGADVLDRVLDIANVGLAAEMLGSAQECFDRSIAYLKEREQFGVAIGSFQALKHRAAALFCEVELARSCVLAALIAIDDPTAKNLALLASAAKVKAGEAFQQVSREAVQFHGGNGMTDEFEIGFFLKRAAVASRIFGDAGFHRDRYGALSGY